MAVSHACPALPRAVPSRAAAPQQPPGAAAKRCEPGVRVPPAPSGQGTRRGASVERCAAGFCGVNGWGVSQKGLSVSLKVAFKGTCQVKTGE